MIEYPPYEKMEEAMDFHLHGDRPLRYLAQEAEASGDIELLSACKLVAEYIDFEEFEMTRAKLLDRHKGDGSRSK